jgi:hypothetical protein
MKAHLSLWTLGAALVFTQGCTVEDDPETTFSSDYRGSTHKKKNCTYTQGYWKNHVEHWPGNTATLVGCGQTWPENLETPPATDAFYILSHQWITTTLNRAQGAASTPELNEALLEAGAMLYDCEITEDEHDAAIAFAEYFDAYNNGEWGPGHCDDVLADD